jgi:hypothetical protein
VFDATYEDNGLVSVPLIGIEVESRDEFKRDVMPIRCKVVTPVGNGGVRKVNVMHELH